MAGIDIMSAGLTLGTATTIGAILGATWKTGQHYKDTLKSKLTNRHYLCLDNATLTLLCLRGLTAIQHLHQRGHASQQSYQLITPSKDNEFIDQMKPFWKQAQQHPEWEKNTLPESHPTLKNIQTVLEKALTSNKH
jgi:hypothetical protein